MSKVAFVLKIQISKNKMKLFLKWFHFGTSKNEIFFLNKSLTPTANIIQKIIPKTFVFTHQIMNFYS